MANVTIVIICLRTKITICDLCRTQTPMSSCVDMGHALEPLVFAFL